MTRPSIHPTCNNFFNDSMNVNNFSLQKARSYKGIVKIIALIIINSLCDIERFAQNIRRAKATFKCPKNYLLFNLVLYYIVCQHLGFDIFPLSLLFNSRLSVCSKASLSFRSNYCNNIYVWSFKNHKPIFPIVSILVRFLRTATLRS